MSSQKQNKRKESKHERILRQAREAAESNSQELVGKPEESKMEQHEIRTTEPVYKDSEQNPKKRKMEIDNARDRRHIPSEKGDTKGEIDSKQKDENATGNEDDFEGLMALAKPTKPSATPVTGAKKEALLREVIPVWMKSPVDIQECFDAAEDKVKHRSDNSDENSSDWKCCLFAGA
jgi:hypothetical protein